jgi:3-oxosteroid 1-dehydrogenase
MSAPRSPGRPPQGPGADIVATSYDLVIVGSGAGGLVAALRAKALGLSPVILEKQEKVGGSTGLSGGVMWIPGNPAQARAGVADSFEAAWTYLENLVGPNGGRGATPERWRAFLTNGPEMIAFLEAQGMPFQHCVDRSDYHDELPGGNALGRSIETPIFDGCELGDWIEHLQGNANPYPVTGSEMRFVLLAQARLKGALTAFRMLSRIARQRLFSRRYLGVGAAIAGRLLKAVLAAGVPILTDATVTGLQVRDGRVSGVIARIKGRETHVSARRGVLLAAGGFARNRAMRDQHGQKPASTDWTHANPGDTGEVLQLAVKLGAAVDMMDFSWWVPTSVLPDGRPAMNVADLAKPGCILVDQGGERFVDEAGSYVAIGLAMYGRNKTQAAIPSWAIMDGRYLDRYPWSGRLPFQTPKDWGPSGYMRRGGSIESLAKACGIPPDRLAQTIARFNGFVDAGRDDDFARGARQYDGYYGDPFHKPSPTLGRIDYPPFYAVRIFPGDVGTAGGLVCDDQARVLREDGSIVEGLFAAGNITAPVFGATYPGAGASIAPSAVFGFIAATALAGNQQGLA